MRVSRICFFVKEPFYPALQFEADPCLFEVNDDSAWSEVDKIEKMKELGLQIKRNFANVTEQNFLLNELEETVFKRLKYERGHWDGVISNYRETEKMNWKPESLKVIQRMKSLFPESWNWRPATHILDLQKEGEIKPHIDNVSEVVVGLSLLSR